VTPTQQTKLLTAIEQDLARHARNQALIDRMQHLTLKGKLMALVRRYPTVIAAILGTAAWIVFCVCALADEPPKPPQCPEPTPCKILFLSPQEERALIGQNGILDTAAQGRAIELGGVAVYLKQRIANAPQGEVIKPPPPKPDPTPPTAPAASEDKK
jgi:hypothetical protein